MVRHTVNPNSNMLFYYPLSLSRLLALALWVSGFGIWVTITTSTFLASRSRLTTWRVVFSQNGESGPVTFKGHPIKKFVLDAEVEFEELLARQSKYHEAAASEY
jgi:hypothetical protein